MEYVVSFFFSKITIFAFGTFNGRNSRTVTVLKTILRRDQKNYICFEINCSECFEVPKRDFLNSIHSLNQSINPSKCKTS